MRSGSGAAAPTAAHWCKTIEAISRVQNLETNVGALTKDVVDLLGAQELQNEIDVLVLKDSEFLRPSWVV